jgi:Cu/Ag efflux protein CusF
MFKRIAPFLICLMIATVADAQPGGGGGGGGRGRGGGGGGGGAPPSGSRPAAPAPVKKAAKLNPLPIVGVVKSIDAPGGRITIAYEPVESLGWPAGAQPFPVSKTAMLTAVTVGEKIRFAIDSGEISALAPFDPPAAP